MNEIIVDSFAGGGGASTGIEMALGRSPDIAINHSAEALSMHAANHPATLHLPHDVWKVDPIAVTGGRPVGLLWMSPDCKHFSKAKGGVPREKGIRDLAWVGVRWVEQVRPRMLALENVEEFVTWGPLDDAGMPCACRKGETFQRFVGELRRHGYEVEWRELRACDYGAPTIRKRFFLIARCDGLPIVWPAPTHGSPGSAEVLSGKRLPWRTAAEIIDWSLPCPSIFLTREEGRAVGCNRPLAEATMTRIAKGVRRYVIDAAKPFIVGCGGRMGQSDARPVDKPFHTVTAKADSCVAVPFVAPLTHQGGERGNAMRDPLPTVTAAHRGEQALVAPLISYGQQGGSSRSVEDPMHTICASTKDTNQLVVPHLMTMRNAAKPHNGADKPTHTITAGGAGLSLVTAHVSRQFGASVGSDLDEPIGTVTAGGGGKSALVAAFLAQHNTGVVGHDARAPVSTVTAGGNFGCSQQAVIEASLLAHHYGSGGGEGDVTRPMRAVTAGGNHAAEVRAFLIKYYGNEEDGHGMDAPAGTVTTHDRFGLVTVEGQPYEIVDIGMRMLSPRELFRAQGFPESYIIDRTADGKSINKTAQVRMCGNSVCPPLAAAIVAANYRPDEAAPKPLKRQPSAGTWTVGALFEHAGVVA